MSLLPNNTYANPANSFYGESGASAANELQSPAVVLPDETAQGNVSLTMEATDPNANSTLFIRSDDGLAVLNVDANDVGGAFINMNGLNGAPFFVTNATGVAPFQYTIKASPAQSGQTPFLTYDPSQGTLTLGDSLPNGSVITNNRVYVQSAPTNGNSVEIASVTANVGGISNTCASNGALVLGSSTAVPAILTVADLGVGQASVAIGGNGGNANSGILMTAGSPAFQAPIIRTTAPTSGPLILGSSATNPKTLFISDEGAANTGFVDITGGTGVSGSTAFTLRLQGPNNRQGPTTATISSSLPQGGGGILNLSNAYDESVPNISLTDADTQLNGLVLVPNDLSFQGTGSITAFQTLQTTGVTCGDNTTTGIPNPAGLVIGLYLVLARGTIGGASSPTCSVSTTAYYNGSGWTWGGGGACPALVSAPPSYIGIQGGSASLVLANGGGLGAVTMDFTYLKLGGNLGI